MAESADEKAALAKRLAEAEVSTAASGRLDLLSNFGKAVLLSKVVWARSLSQIDNLLSTANVLYVNFQTQVDAGMRIPEQNEWDQGRDAAESTVSPFFYRNLVYGALSLDGRGVSSYGPYSITLRERMVRLRATAFEENTVLFCRKHKVTAGQKAPLGYRVAWPERDILAKAKLHSQLLPDTTDRDFPKVLLQDSDNPDDCDFIEVHIYGTIHRSAIERVVGPRPNNRRQLAIWKSVGEKLSELGATLETI